jgi:ABC-2 type transport system permease protein
MFGLPVVQIVLFGFALTSEVRNAKVLILDRAKDANSKALINRLGVSSYFSIEMRDIPDAQIEKEFRKGQIKCAIIIPAGFSVELKHDGHSQIQILADGTDPNIAKTMITYITSIIHSYQLEISKPTALPFLIVAETRMLYNEEANGSLNFIPGVMALILMIVCTALTSVSIVKEKEMGTMEILLVSPFRPLMVLVSKAIPYLVLSLVNFTLIIILSVYALHVDIKGSIPLLFAEGTLLIITCLSFGLLISNVTSSQQTALLLSMMGMMIPTMVFTGFMFPLENMPWIFRVIAHVVPSRWFYTIIKAVMLKGLGFAYVWKETLILGGMTTFLLAVALKNFKIRLT